jgi:hypothetical protein
MGGVLDDVRKWLNDVPLWKELGTIPDRVGFVPILLARVMRCGLRSRASHSNRAALGLEQAHNLAWSGIQRLRQLQQHYDRGRFQPPFNLAHVGPMYSRALGQFFLRELGGQPEPGDNLPEDDIGVAHPTII